MRPEAYEQKIADLEWKIKDLETSVKAMREYIEDKNERTKAQVRKLEQLEILVDQYEDMCESMSNGHRYCYNSWKQAEKEAEVYKKRLENYLKMPIENWIKAADKVRRIVAGEVVRN